MTVSAVLLIAYIAVLLTLAPRLARTPWAARAPGPFLWLWHSLVAGLATSVLLALASLCLLPIVNPHDLDGLVDAGFERAALIVTNPLCWLTVGVGVGVWFLAGRAALRGVRAVLAWTRVDRKQRATLRLLGTPTDGGYTLLDSGEPVAYCLPGGLAQIVVTSAAADRLDADELRAVVAHERAHQRSHHHAHVRSSKLLALLVPIPLGRLYSEQIARLVELHADEGASRTIDPIDLAGAIVALGRPRVRASIGLHANRTATAERVQRLLTPAELPRLRERILVRMSSVLLVVAPLALVIVLESFALTRACPELFGAPIAG